jgi:hypothetical protein
MGKSTVQGREPSLLTIIRAEEPGEPLAHGGHRIGHFVGDRRHDKWWHLCEVEAGGLGDDPEYWRRLHLKLREGNWTAAGYEDESQVIDATVADVTRDVKSASKATGILGTET